ncbi:MAG: MFS transporter [Oscillospiraceae bacterium]|jgi:Na+/melibiose symporter-like transporter|nr:MFS transporter [Oscillospiraceae bacterium]
MATGTGAAPLTERKPIVKLPEKIGFGLISTATNIVYQFKGVYYLIFLTDAVGMDMRWAGIILTIGTIWDAVNDPLLGYWAVNRRFKSGEALRPFAKYASPGFGLSFIFLFTGGILVKAAEVNSALQIALALVIYIIFEVFNTLTAIPYNSMSGLASDIDADRRSINVFRNLGGGLGAAIGSTAAMPLMKLFRGLDAQGNITRETGPRGFFGVSCLLAVILVGGCLFHYFTTKERVKEAGEDSSHIPFLTIAKLLLQCKSWVWNTLYCICYGINNLLLMTCLSYYAKYVLGSNEKVTPFMVAFIVAGLAGSATLSMIDKRIGRRNTMMLACLFGIAGKIWSILDGTSEPAMFVNAVCVGIQTTYAFILFNTNRGSIVDIIEHRFGRRIDAMVASSDNLANKLALAAATQFITLSLAHAGFDSTLGFNGQPATVAPTILFMITWAPLIVSAVMLVAAFFIPIEKEYGEVAAERGAVPNADR